MDIMTKKVFRLGLVLCSLFVAISCSKTELENSELIDGSETYSTSALGDGASSGNGSNGGNQDPEPGQITSGEWNDLDNWTFWQDLMQQNDWHQYQEQWGFNTLNRYEVEILDKNGLPVVDAKVELLDSKNAGLWQARTDNKGQAELFAELFESNQDPAKIEISYNNQSHQINQVVLSPTGINTLTINQSSISPKKLNVYFAVDATGSMSDEIEYLKAELEDVIGEVQSQFTDLDILLGTTFYRDEGDDYLTQNMPFSSDIGSVANFVDNQSADGGGDFPEAVHTALAVALSEQWENNAIGRILFLILDAPPHYNPEVVESIHQSIEDAARLGVKIIPVTASGIDKETEFLMRFMAIATNGTYTFITDHSGIGNDHLAPTVGQYSVELLNELLIRLINENCE